MRGQQKTASDGANKQTDKQTDGHRNSMTELAQWGGQIVPLSHIIIAQIEAPYIIGILAWIVPWGTLYNAFYSIHSCNFLLFLLVCYKVFFDHISCMTSLNLLLG